LIKVVDLVDGLESIGTRMLVPFDGESYRYMDRLGTGTVGKVGRYLFDR